MEEDGLQPDTFVKNGRRKLEKTVERWMSESDEPALNLKHPYYWANFVMIGNANISMRGMEKRVETNCSEEETKDPGTSQKERTDEE